jgi:hypothetical protein
MSWDSNILNLSVNSLRQRQIFRHSNSGARLIKAESLKRKAESAKLKVESLKWISDRFKLFAFCFKLISTT